VKETGKVRRRIDEKKILHNLGNKGSQVGNHLFWEERNV